MELNNRIKGQGAIEFFLIAGFILLASSVLLTQADEQIRGTSALNNVIIARNALDLEMSAIRYVYLSGNQSKISQRVFIPVGAQCYYRENSESRLYCIVPGAARRVVSDTFAPMPTIQPTCHRSGWVTLTTTNIGTAINVTC